MNKNTHHLLLHGIPFSIDYKNKRLVQDSYPANKIPFRVLEQKDGFLTGELHCFDEEPFDPSEATIAPFKMAASLLTRAWEHTLENAATFNVQSYEEQWNVLLYDGPITRRLNGILPVIDIAGDPFIVDWRLRELRSQKDFFCRIYFDDLFLSADGEHYCGYYHTPSKQIIKPDPEVVVLAQDTVWVEIPGEIYLDPIGVAREYDMNETFLLNNFPINENLSAKVKRPDGIANDNQQQRPKM